MEMDGRLIFVFFLVHSIASLPYSQDQFDYECNKIRRELEDVPKAKREKLLIQKVAKAHLENEEKIEEIGALREQKLAEAKYRWVFVARTRLERLEKDYLPTAAVNPDSRFLRWKFLLSLPVPELQYLRKKVIEEYQPIESTLPHDELIDIFALLLQKIYGDSYETEKAPAPENPKDDEVLSKLCSGTLDEEEEKEFREFMGIVRVDTDPKYMKALFKILVEDIPSQGTETSPAVKSSLGADQFHCMVIYPAACNGRFPNRDRITDRNVDEFFPTLKPEILSVRFEFPSDLTSHNKDRIVIQFPDTTTALEAYKTNPGYMKKTKVRLYIFSCEEDLKF